MSFLISQESNKAEKSDDIPPDKASQSSEPASKSSDLQDGVDESSSNCTEPKPKAKSIQTSKSQPSLYSSRRNSLNIEQRIKECTSDSQASTSNKKPIVLPKIDINKRKHLFEKASSNDEEDSKLRKSVSSGNISKTKSIKDRLSMFGKQEEPVNPRTDKMFLPKVSVKEILSSIERQNSAEMPFNSSSVEDIKSSHIIKHCLSNSKSESNKISESPNTKPIKDNEFNKPQIKEQDSRQECRMNEESNSASHCNNFVKQTISKPNLNSEPDTQRDNIYNADGSEKCLSSDDECRNGTKHFRHRSLDSLNSDSKFESIPFARVQSFEELDFRDRGSCLSGDTDREDSGIHTADVSSCVSQSDDCDTDMDMHHLEATNLSVIPEVIQEQTVTNASQYDTSLDLQLERHTQSNAAANELREDLVNANIVLNHAEKFPDQSNCDSYYQIESNATEETVASVNTTESPANLYNTDTTKAISVTKTRQSPEKVSCNNNDCQFQV